MAKIILGSIVKAPEFLGIKAWINSEPLEMKKLRGKVVLIDFWTYTCINYIRTLPHMKELYDRYHDKSLVIIGIHTPEFDFKKDVKNVKEAVKKHVFPIQLLLTVTILCGGLIGMCTGLGSIL